MLYAALECLDAGDTIGAGVRLREAVLRYVAAAADWYGIDVPRKQKYARAGQYIDALSKAGQMDTWAREYLLEMIDAGNKAAHCQRVPSDVLKGGISLLFALMDGQPYCPHERQPLITSHETNLYDLDDCDDDDSADWWKKGGAA
jgi:hypothetical protein